jgi:hypothetical protein
LRVGEVQKNLADEISAAESTLTTTNKIAGTILDLRFAEGDDLAAAKATADLFTAQKLPLAILVNGETHGAAATLATDLQESRAGLVFGGSTEVKPDIAVAVKTDDEKKVSGQSLRAARAGRDQRRCRHEYGDLSTFIDHTSEADLVREKIKDGDEDEDSMPPRPARAAKTLHPRPDVLARAVDLIKALAVIRQPHA